LLTRHRFLVCNYDLLHAQTEKDDTGTVIIRDDLPGWGRVLGSQHFDMAIASESHRLRGWQSKGAGGKEAQSRRERASELCDLIPRAYCETGTPVYGFTRDLWGQLDFLTGGLWS